MNAIIEFMQNNKCDLKANCIDYELYITIILISDKALNVNYSPVKNDYNNQQLRNDKVYILSIMHN